MVGPKLSVRTVGRNPSKLGIPKNTEHAPGFFFLYSQMPAIIASYHKMIASTQTNHPLAGGKTGSKGPTDVELARDRLRAGGLRITQPRLAILEILIRRGKPLSIETIHGALGTGSCDVVTVYRCMAAFEAIGLVRRAFLINGTSLYEINLGETANYHAFCRETDRVEEIEPESAAELRLALRKVEDALRARGYSDVGHIVEFFGISPGARRSADVPNRTAESHGDPAAAASRSVEVSSLTPPVR
jgi:Fur family ferric uptake transcriptional regulator